MRCRGLCPKAHASADGAGSSIIGLLEVCESDFSKDLAGIIAAEESAVNDYESTTQANSIDKTTKEADVKYKTKEATSLDKARRGSETVPRTMGLGRNICSRKKQSLNA